MLCGDRNGKEIQQGGDVCIRVSGSLRCASETNRASLGVGAVLGLSWSSGFSPVAARKGYFLVTVPEVLTVLASPASEHRLSGEQASVVAARGLRRHGSRAIELCGAPQPAGSSHTRDRTSVS